MKFPIKTLLSATFVGSICTTCYRYCNVQAQVPICFAAFWIKERLMLLKSNKGGVSVILLDLRYFIDTFDHPHAKYAVEIIRAVQSNICLVYNGFCGAVDCFNEASYNHELPTIVLDCSQNPSELESVDSSSLLLNGITKYIKELPLRSLSLQLLHKISSLFDTNHNSYQSFVQKLSTEDIMNFFFSILNQYPCRMLNEEQSLSRSAVVVIQTSFHSFHSLDYQILELIAKECPQVLFVISVNDVISVPSNHCLCV